MLTQLQPVVFISSTINELTKERELASKAVYCISALPNMSEKTFLASDKNSIEKCLAEVRDSDIYILILGGKYGYRLNNGKSITEIEWEHAKKHNKPILVFNLTYLNKESDQEEFASRVGNIYSGKFWCAINNIDEVEKKIRDSIARLIDDYKIQRVNKTEKLYSNLFKIEFPEYLFIGDLSIDRNETIKDARETGNFLKNNASDRNVIRAALRLRNLSFSSDWVSNSKKLFTFHDINNKDLPLHQIIENGTIEKIRSTEYSSINEDCLRVFKSLLHNCFKQKVYRLGIEWQNEDNIFIFLPLEDEENTIKNNRIYRKWVSKKEAKRFVFERVMKNTKTDEILRCKHLAFSIRFFRFDQRWYLSITPEWFISYDEYHKSLFGSKDISYMKRKERNQHVFNHLRFISYILNLSQDISLFSNPYPFLTLKENISFDGFPILEDNLWLNNESNVTQRIILDEQKPADLFDELSFY